MRWGQASDHGFKPDLLSDLQVTVRYSNGYEFSVLSTRFRFEGRKFSKCACSELKTGTRNRPPSEGRYFLRQELHIVSLHSNA